MKIILTVFISVALFSPEVFCQSEISAFLGVAFANVKGENIDRVPQVLVVNPDGETSKGFLFGVSYSRYLASRSLISLKVQTNSYRTAVSISRVQLPPESIVYREIAISPQYGYEIIDDKLRVSVGPRITALSNHKQILVDVNETEIETKIEGKGNILYGIDSGLMFMHNSAWIGAEFSFPLGLLDTDSYRGYLAEYTSFSLKIGYAFQFGRRQ